MRFAFAAACLAALLTLPALDAVAARKKADDGRPRSGAGTYTEPQREVVQRNLRKIRNAADAMMRYHRYQQGGSPRPSKAGRPQGQTNQQRGTP